MSGMGGGGPAIARSASIGGAPPPGLKRRLLHSAQKLLYLSGAARLCGSRCGASALVLMYHSVCPASDAPWVAPRNRMTVERFEAQMSFLARTGRVVDLDRLLRAGRGDVTLPPGAVVLTFDDGYRDNLTVVAEILARHELPAVLYLATGYVSRTENQWADRLYSCLTARTRHRLDWGGEVWDLRCEEEIEAYHRQISAMLLCASMDDRGVVLDDLAEQLAPEGAAPRLTMSWEEVRDLRERFPRFCLGVHTSGHVDLSSLGPEEALAEVTTAFREFEAELGEAPQHFSFPYSRVAGGLREAMVELGLMSAMGGEGMAIPGALEPFDIPRVQAPASRLLLGYYASGAHPGLSRALFGRA